MHVISRRARVALKQVRENPNSIVVKVRNIADVPQKPFPCCSFLEWSTCGVMAAGHLGVIRVDRNTTLTTWIERDTCRIRSVWTVGPYEVRTKTAVLALSAQISAEMEDMLRIEAHTTLGRELARCFLLNEYEQMVDWLDSLDLYSEGEQDV